MLKKILPLRIGVGAIVLNNNNQIFVGKRKDNPIDKWQMPQGGVNKNEDFLNAMKRELEEETSIKSIEVLKTLDNFFVYELPKELIGIIWRGRFRGQKQKWFIVRFKGKESEINLRTKHPEFIEWKWIEMGDLPKVIVNFKKNVYENLLIELRKYFNSHV
ncbi:RNA pyrophosphohydrolase [Candidatus Pelagibacter bacterium]|nr:RNA pyrophosphohydrolase [Candidatus Pelagibacter bacterium]|tara:strand:- start:180 stop:659 length:480 start_codon:yes stop_codon:yes gene_type:complete